MNVLHVDDVGVADIVARRDARALARPRSTTLTARAAKHSEAEECLMDPSQVIIRPVVSEKSYVLATADKYTFRVHDDAHKTQIKQAVEAAVRRQRASRCAPPRCPPSPSAAAYTAGRTREWKKAVVQVRQGETIPIFQGLEADL